MTRASTVDVLVPTKDRPAALAATLASLLGCSHRPLRVIIADQGVLRCEQSDEVRAVLRTLELTGAPVQLLRNLPRRGMAQQRQVLLEHAEAPYALFVDDDVLLEPDLIDRLLEALRREQCGFVGSFVNAPGAVKSGDPIDEPPADVHIEPWEGPVRPEVVLPDTPQWERHRLHFAAYLHRLGHRLGLDRERALLYRVAWVGGCYLIDVAKLKAVGGFDFWPELPVEHSGEDVVAQLRLMAGFGGAGLAPSGAWHQEVATTRPGGEPDAPRLLDLPALLAMARLSASRGGVTPRYASR